MAGSTTSDAKTSAPAATTPGAKLSSVQKAKSATAVIRGATSNEDYRDGFRNLSLIVNLMCIIIFCLVVVNLYFVTSYKPQDSYFAETVEDARKIPLAGLPYPNVNQAALLTWATDAATSSLTFGFHDYEERLGAIRPFFTQVGWADFRTAMTKSKIIENAVSKRQLYTAIPRAPATVIYQGLDKGKFVWVVEVQLLITIRSGGVTKSEPQNIRMMVVRAPTNELAAGIGIELWLSM